MGIVAANGKLAEELEVSPERVTRTLKTFGAPELVRFTRYEDVRLAEVAKFLALHLSRRHRLIVFFVKTFYLVRRTLMKKRNPWSIR